MPGMVSMDDMTKVFVWLGNTDAMGMTMPTEIDVTVHCEEGMPSSIDDPSADTASMLGR